MCVCVRTHTQRGSEGDGGIGRERVRARERVRGGRESKGEGESKEEVPRRKVLEKPTKMYHKRKDFQSI